MCTYNFAKKYLIARICLIYVCVQSLTRLLLRILERIHLQNSCIAASLRIVRHQEDIVAGARHQSTHFEVRCAIVIVAFEAFEL